MKLDVGNPAILDILASWGAPYVWGAGIPSDGHKNWPDGPPVGLRGIRGWDCGGLAQAILVRLELLPGDAPDRTAAGLHDASTPVPEGMERLGDLCFYGPGSKVSHVTVVLGPGVCIGANGGRSFTNGNNPLAFVQLQPIHYRDDFKGIRRLG